jgi:hypothetical protein
LLRHLPLISPNIGTSELLVKKLAQKLFIFVGLLNRKRTLKSKYSETLELFSLI